MTATDVGYPALPSYSDGFLEDEDNALRRHLMGIEVYDQHGNPRPVGVWFSHPDMEIREQKYPYAVIDLIDVTEATDRVVSGFYQGLVPAFSFPAELLPEGFVLSPVDRRIYNAQGLWSDVWYDKSSFPVEVLSRPQVPVQVDYQIRIFSRHPRHDRGALRGFLGTKVPYRHGWLNMVDIDGTTRRLELLDIGHSQAVENDKRLFVSVFTIRVDSWMPVGEIFLREDQFVTKVVTDLNRHRRLTEDPLDSETIINQPNPLGHQPRSSNE